MAKNQGWVNQLSEKIRVERIKGLFFGSRARGDFMETSDLDLLAISPDFEGKDSLERAKLLQKTWNAVNTTPLKLEAFGYTEEEIRKMKGYSPFIGKIMRNGCVEIRIS